MSNEIIRRVKWVRQDIFGTDTGYSIKAITRKRQEGIWLEGIHWKKAPDGHIMINTVEYDNWVENAA
ncbi:MAG: excisionase family protein [Pseudomonadota bacterium]